MLLCTPDILGRQLLTFSCMEKWHWLGTLWCLQRHGELYFRRDIARGDKHSSKEWERRRLSIFCVNKASYSQGRKFEYKKWIWWLSVFSFWISLLKLLIVLTMTKLLNSTQEEHSSTVCKINSFRESLGSLDCCSSFLGFSYRPLITISE